MLAGNASSSTAKMIVNSVLMTAIGNGDADALGGSADWSRRGCSGGCRRDESRTGPSLHRGKLFAFSCFDGTRGIGSIYGDGSVAGTIQFFGSGPERSASLPAGTLKVKGGAVCASIKGMPFEPCFKLNRTSDHSFRGSVLGLGFAYCDFTRRLNVGPYLAQEGGRNTDGPLRLHP